MACVGGMRGFFNSYLLCVFHGEGAVKECPLGILFLGIRRGWDGMTKNGNGNGWEVGRCIRHGVGACHFGFCCLLSLLPLLSLRYLFRMGIFLRWEDGMRYREHGYLRWGMTMIPRNGGIGGYTPR